MNPIIIDVRERTEFKTGHIQHSINMPLSEIREMAPGLIGGLVGQEVLLVCQVGKRSAMAKAQLEAMGLGARCKLTNLVGGINKWNDANRPVVSLVAARGVTIPVMRQVLLAAGVLIVLFVAAGFLISPWGFLAAGLIGGGLTFAGSTGICPMAMVLSRMPWNRS